MLLHTHVIKANPQYDASRSRAPWTIDGQHFFNDGNLAECGVNEHFGYGFRYDKKAVAFDIGSDIEALRMSVKSNGCSLACVYRTNKETAKAEIIAEYFERVHSNRWAYVVRTDMSLEIYEMNAMEFRQFVEKFSGLSRESGKDYYKLKIRTTDKMMAWLKAQL
jgi:hypothetical protein